MLQTNSRSQLNFGTNKPKNNKVRVKKKGISPLVLENSSSYLKIIYESSTNSRSLQKMRTQNSSELQREAGNAKQRGFFKYPPSKEVEARNKKLERGIFISVFMYCFWLRKSKRCCICKPTGWGKKGISGVKWETVNDNRRLGEIGAIGSWPLNTQREK